MDTFLSVAGIVGLALLGVLALAVAFCPWFIAKARGHKSASGILVCTLIGLVLWPVWIAAFIWAFTGDNNSEKRTRVIRSSVGFESMYRPAPPSVRSIDAELDSRV